MSCSCNTVHYITLAQYTQRVKHVYHTFGTQDIRYFQYLFKSKSLVHVVCGMGCVINQDYGISDKSSSSKCGIQSLCLSEISNLGLFPEIICWHFMSACVMQSNYIQHGPTQPQLVFY